VRTADKEPELMKDTYSTVETAETATELREESVKKNPLSGNSNQRGGNRDVDRGPNMTRHRGE